MSGSMSPGPCRAVVSRDGLVLQRFLSEQLAPGQVRIAVAASGVNEPDERMIQGMTALELSEAQLPGSEVAGEVIEVAPGVSAPQVGDRVMAWVEAGGYASEVITVADACVALPASMDYGTAAGFLVAYGTAYYALVQRAELRAGEALLVHRASGALGSAALDIAQQLGARAIAVDDSDDKLERTAQMYRVPRTINCRTHHKWSDKVKELTMAAGADVVYDSVGGDTLDDSVRCTAWDGRIILIGFASDTAIEQVTAKRLLARNAALLGARWDTWAARDPAQNRRHFATLLGWYEAGKLQPHISHTAPIARAREVLEAISQGQLVGKCVLTLR